jgi:hypothetical protein
LPDRSSPDVASRPSLVPHFFAVGLAGGWLTADAHRLGTRGEELVYRVLLVSITPLTAALLASHLERSHSASPLPGLGFGAKTVLAGALNGMIIGCFAMLGWGTLIGAVWGGFCAVPFLPALGVIALANRRIGRARRRSLVDASDRRAPLVATSAVVAAACLVTTVVDRTDAARSSLAIAAAAAAAIVLVVDSLALLRASRGLLPERDLRPRDPIVAPGTGDALVVDYGLGDETHERVAIASHAYRSADRVVAVVRGSRSRAAGALLRAVIADVAAVALGVVAAAFAAR